MENVSWLDPLPARIFITTRWTMINACNQANEARAEIAVAELCQTYWQPVYTCIRHHGHSAHNAEDLTQDFFLRLLKGAWLKHLNEAEGRFRAYLGVALRNFLRDQWRRRWTLRHGRGKTLVSFDALEAEAGYACILAGNTTPESLYERQWAKTVIEHATEQLRIELRANGKEALLEHFDAIMSENTYGFPYEEVARSMNLSLRAMHTALYRCRQRFHILLREEIARTVAVATEIDEELRHLQRIFARP